MNDLDALNASLEADMAQLIKEYSKRAQRRLLEAVQPIFARHDITSFGWSQHQHYNDEEYIFSYPGEGAYAWEEIYINDVWFEDEVNADSADHDVVRKDVQELLSHFTSDLMRKIFGEAKVTVYQDRIEYVESKDW